VLGGAASETDGRRGLTIDDRHGGRYCGIPPASPFRRLRATRCPRNRRRYTTTRGPAPSWRQRLLDSGSQINAGAQPPAKPVGCSGSLGGDSCIRSVAASWAALSRFWPGVEVNADAVLVHCRPGYIRRYLSLQVEELGKLGDPNPRSLLGQVADGRKHR
jgi:hypothetical protein